MTGEFVRLRLHQCHSVVGSYPRLFSRPHFLWAFNKFLVTIILSKFVNTISDYSSNFYLLLCFYWTLSSSKKIWSCLLSSVFLRFPWCVNDILLLPLWFYVKDCVLLLDGSKDYVCDCKLYYNSQYYIQIPLATRQRTRSFVLAMTFLKLINLKINKFKMWRQLNF